MAAFACAIGRKFGTVSDRQQPGALQWPSDAPKGPLQSAYLERDKLRLALGVDLGSANMRAVVIDRNTGRVVASMSQQHGDRSPAAVVTALALLMNRVSKQAGATTPLPCAIGAAGTLNGSEIVLSPTLGWHDVPLGELLGRELGRPIKIVNDTHAAAFGELKAGAARGESHTFTVLVGAGIGSAIVTGGALMEGAHGVAGELGHIKVVAEGGRPCGCGENGCLEAYAGGTNLEAWMKEAGLQGTASELETQAHHGNADAKKIWDFASSSLALAIANVVTILNPGFVVLGGGVMTHSPRLVQRVCDAIGERSLAASRAGLKVALAAHGDDSGAVGAALLGAEGY